jgi:subtilisin-like proprotein convertase family protein
MRRSLIFLILLIFNGLNAQNLMVDGADQPPYNNPAGLIQSFFTGSGLEIIEIAHSGKPEAVGFFSAGLDALGLERGLLMTTGKVNSGPGQIGASQTGIDFANVNNGSTAVSGELLALADNTPMRDVAVYRIRFRPFGDSIRFRYVFASEEYPEYACSQYNDIFGFFLSGPDPAGGQYVDKNIALVPGTALPVAINYIHPANPIYVCPPAFEAFYVNNNGSNTQPTYDGLTLPFVAAAAVTPCAEYEMLLAIGDVADGLYDSAVFLEGNSFGGDVQISASFDAGNNLLPEGSSGDTVAISFQSLPPQLLPVTVTIGGTAANGVDYQAIAGSYLIETTDTVLQLVFQPLPDTLTEVLETIEIGINNDACLSRTFSILLMDADSNGLQSPAEFALVAGGTVLLDANPLLLAQSSWSFANNEAAPIPAGNSEGLPLESPIEVAVPFEALGDLNILESVCFDIQHGWAGDLDVYLRAPDGRFVELTTDNGANGDNYTNTCFSPAADADALISLPGPFAPASAAPFTGTFKAEGNWADILNSPIQGTWHLVVIDQSQGFNGTLLGWSLDFSAAKIGGFQYLWSTGDTSQTIEATAPGLYEVQISNAVSSMTRRFLVRSDCPFSQLNTQICAGEELVLNGMVFDENNPSGTVLYDLPGAGCDSTVLVDLDVLPNSAAQLDVVISAGQSYEVGGQLFNTPGIYTIPLTASNGCDSIVTLQLDVVSGTQDPALAGLQLSPNPVSDLLQVSWAAGQRFQRLRLSDLSGKVLTSREIGPNERQMALDLSDMRPGAYILMLERGAGEAPVFQRLFKN